MLRIRTCLPLLALLCVGPLAPARPAGSKPGAAAEAPRVQAAARPSTTIIKRTPLARKAPAPRPSAKATPLTAFPITAVPSPEGGRLVLRDGPVSASFTDRGIALALTRKLKDAKAAVSGLVWNLVGARPVAPRAEGRTSARIHTLAGDRSRWSVNQPAYGQVVYDQVRPGVDVVVEARPKGLKYTLRAAAGGPRSIPIRYEGARDIRTTPDGAAIEISVDGGSLREAGLICYQEGPEGRTPVAARYAAAGGDSYSIELGDVDPTRPVVIDPTIDWSTYLGGSDNPGEEGAAAVVVDVDGNVYVAGLSGASDFPTTPPSPLPPSITLPDSFLAKFAPDGTLVWVTYLGGGDFIRSLAVDAAGKLVFTGMTNGTNILPFNAWDSTCDGQDAFVLQLNPKGDDIVFYTFLGGTGTDAGTGVGYDASGNVIVSGYTDSVDLEVTDSTTYGGGFLDGFVAKYAVGGALEWASYLGGADHDSADALAVDPAGNAYLTGYTASTDFPVTDGAFRTFPSGGGDAFVTKLSPAGELVYSSYLGSAGTDNGFAIAVTADGEACVTGSAYNGFPTYHAFMEATADGPAAFVLKMNAAGTFPVWSTLLGGNSSAFSFAIAVDASGEVTVAGRTQITDFPVVDAAQQENAGNSDAFVTRFAASGRALRWSTYLGGSGDDFAYGVALAPDGGTIVVGHTQSTDFPTSNAYASVPSGGVGDAFVVRLSPTPPPPPVPTPFDLGQYHLATGTPIDVGGTAQEVLIQFAIGGDEEAETQIEVVPVGTPFTGDYTSINGPYPGGAVVDHFLQGLTPGGYQWRARQVTALGESPWVSFGGNEENPPAAVGDADFVIEASPPVDSTPPTLQVLRPKKGERTIGTPAVDVEGVASDNVLLSAVTWTNLTTGQAGVADGTATWSASVPLIHGMNEIRIQAVDHVGLTASATIQIRRP
jgi:hypothetical protein